MIIAELHLNSNMIILKVIGAVENAINELEFKFQYDNT